MIAQVSIAVAVSCLAKASSVAGIRGNRARQWRIRISRPILAGLSGVLMSRPSDRPNRCGLDHARDVGNSDVRPNTRDRDRNCQRRARLAQRGYDRSPGSGGNGQKVQDDNPVRNPAGPQLAKPPLMQRQRRARLPLSFSLLPLQVRFVPVYPKTRPPTYRSNRPTKSAITNPRRRPNVRFRPIADVLSPQSCSG